MVSARSIRVRGVVQGVGFRPFVFRLACANTLSGWVLNAEEGVEIHLEGDEPALQAFLRGLEAPPPAAHITAIDVAPAIPSGLTRFTIRDSRRHTSPTVRISPDLPVCSDCLRELFAPGDQRYQYPYINCTNCGPRYTIVLALPYDRSRTTMSGWPLDPPCAAQYHDPADRRFHAQPVACPVCGPHYFLRIGGECVEGDTEAIHRTADLLLQGGIVAIKGLGGYHLACDARNASAVRALRERKFRKEKPFAVMARDLDQARLLVELTPEAEAALTSIARPIVLATARQNLEFVAPDNDELGVMLPYTPLHNLLFAAGTPDVLVMTSANRSNEPIAYQDEDALDRLGGIADAFLIGQRPIARRVDDSVVRAGAFGPSVLRRARGYAPGAVARLPFDRPILAVGADLKNSVTLVVDGQAFVSQNIGDLDHYEAFQSFGETIRDLAAMYEVRWDKLLVVHDCHPQYASTAHALGLAAAEHHAVQHHRAHLASVLAEREAWRERVAGVSFDGTGYGDDGTIWGGEIFVGSVAEGFQRVAHLRPALLPGGDAAARHPVQAAAGFLAQMDGLPDLAGAPFRFPERYQQSLQLARKGVRTFGTTSAGRLFDTAAALAGFTRPISFEGQAAMWLEHLAHGCADTAGVYPFPLVGQELDFRPLLRAVIDDRLRGEDPGAIARRFHRGIAQGLSVAVLATTVGNRLRTVVLAGGVFQNELLLRDLGPLLDEAGWQVWTNRAVPANDGGISLGQAALAAFGRFDKVYA
jgi:hydrogenase maturation protein HypF